MKNIVNSGKLSLVGAWEVELKRSVDGYTFIQAERERFFKYLDEGHNSGHIVRIRKMSYPQDIDFEVIKSDYLIVEQIDVVHFQYGDSVDRKIKAHTPLLLAGKSDDEIRQHIDYSFSYDSCQCGDGDCCGRTPMFVDRESIHFIEGTNFVTFKMHGCQHV